MAGESSVVGGVDLGIGLPDFSVGGMWFWLLIVFLIIVFVLVAGLFIWMYIQWKVFKYKIILFENIAGQGYQVSKKDKGRLIKVGKGGEEILYLRKSKCYRTAYGRKMGKNEYWFAVGQDGYWYNFLLGDLDAKMGMLDIEPIDRDMRYMHVAIRKNIEERYRKMGFMEKYGTLILGAVFLIIMIIGIWLLLSKIGDLIVASTEGTEASRLFVEKATELLSRIDEICSGGSGYHPVT